MTTEADTIALACYGCEIESIRHTMSEAVAAGWQEITEGDIDSPDPLDWYTHIGWCPRCAAKNRGELF